ncbi:MAG TPA: hypothetical protein VGN90_13340 [Pyrinomonadaceae bacterium]|jgi:hypothetical protein|nr:hypothetical protein [Pyrinomonadaceae bacterium]
MKIILFLTMLLMLIPQNQTAVISREGNPVVVVSYKWFKDRQELTQPPEGTIPAAAMIPQNKNFEKNRRANTSPGERDPNLDTVDGRSAAMEKAVQQSRAVKPMDGFAYRAKVHNASAKLIEVIFWEYQFKELTTSSTLSRRQFLCGVSIKPEKDKELQAFSLSGPRDVVSVEALAKKSGETAEEKVLINRVEYADGSIWQRKDWNFGEVRLGYARAVATPWGTEMCRGL